MSAKTDDIALAIVTLKAFRKHQMKEIRRRIKLLERFASDAAEQPIRRTRST